MCTYRDKQGRESAFIQILPQTSPSAMVELPRPHTSLQDVGLVLVPLAEVEGEVGSERFNSLLRSHS